MILIITLLFIFGVFAIFLEVVLPFGVSATLGFIAIGASGYIAVTQEGPVKGALYCVMALAVAIVVARFSIKSGLKAMELKPPGRGRRGKTRAGAAPASAAKDPPRGALARVIQPLRPTGAIEWEGKRLAARTAQPEIECPRGATVRIKGRDSTFWVVEKVEPGRGESSAGGAGVPGDDQS